MLSLSVHIYSITILTLSLPSLRDESSYPKTTEKTSRLWTVLIFVKFYYHAIIEDLRHICVLASGAMRALEALSIRNCDIDFSTSPTRIHIRSQFTKTKVSRDIYISDEATKFLKEFLDFKYRDKGPGRINLEKTPEQLVFGKQQRSKGVSFLYHKLRIEFNKILQTLKMDERKEGMLRRKVTFHSLRRHAKTVISDQTNQDYSEWYLGHAGSPYYTKKEADRRELYATKCMKYLTFLDYTTLESTGKNIELKLVEKEKEINYLRERDLKRETEMQTMREDMDKVISYIRENPNLAKVKTEVLSEI